MALLPPNASTLERAVELLLGARVDALDVPLRKLWSAQDCPADLLPWLAWALSIDQWDPAWPEAVRRARIASAIAVQRRKGTIQSIRDVIASLGGTVALREWFETSPPGDPHTFTLSVSLAGLSGEPPSAEYIDTLVATVNSTKPLRSHYTFVVAQQAHGAIGMRAEARPAVFTRLPCDVPAYPIPGNGLTFGGYMLTLGGEPLTIGA